MTYVLLIYRADAGKKLTDAEERAALRAHRALQKEATGRGELRAVARLEEARDARTVKRRSSSKAHDVVDGPFVESKEWLVGFYLVDCATEAQAIERAKVLCDDAHHVVEVRPVVWQWEE